MSVQIVSEQMDEIFYQLCKNLDTPKSLAAWLLYSCREHVQLLQLSARPCDYLEHQHNRFRDDYLVCEYLSKSDFLQTGIDTKAVAQSSWIEAERACKAANRRIRHFIDHNGREAPLLVTQAILLAQKKIFECLGPVVPWRRMLAKFKWGKGATFSVKGEAVRLDAKIEEKQISITPEALPIFREAISCDYALMRARGIEAEGPCYLVDSEFSVVRGNRGIFVPKNAKTDRFIAAEPSGNIFLQLGVGRELRSCLKRVGINLDDQGVNQTLARRALALGLATIDLKQASDTICRELVWLLLPPTWARLLDALRSPCTTLDGSSWHVNEKFSSMGNGYTFELETLIFWGLTEALRDLSGAKGRVSVYGDDIICPAELALTELFSFVGFSINSKKSHVDGVFRESCGMHFFRGIDVTPIYQKVLPQREETHRCWNRLLYHAVDRGWRCGRVLLADRKLRFVTSLPSRFLSKEQLKRSPRVPIIGNPDFRSLDGGIATSFTDLFFRWTPRGWKHRARVFRPTAFDASHASVYANTLRSNYLRGCHVQTQQPGNATEALPFDGTLTMRDRGVWRTCVRYAPEACVLRWV